MSQDSVTRILFICMGNICRSPLAEGVFLHHCADRGISEEYEIDSAGIGGWHAGDQADPRSRAVALRHGITLVTPSRQVTSRDFETFDLLVAMDEENVRDLIDLGCPEIKIRSLMQYHPDSTHDHVPDPYYGGDEGFDLVYQLVDEASRRFIDDLQSSS